MNYKIDIESSNYFRQKDIIDVACYRLPTNVLKLIDKYNCKIEIVSNLSYSCASSKCAGSYLSQEKIIQIKHDTNYLEDVFYHEVGHMFDDLVLFNKDVLISSYGLFEHIYNKEYMNFKCISYNYCTRDTKEYFAQAFAEFMLNPSRLKKNTPYTYKFIKACIEYF